MPKTIYLKTPISKEDILDLKIDDIVYLTGDTYTMIRDNHFTNIIDTIKQNLPLPMDLKNKTIYTTGTIFNRKPEGGYDFLAIGATTSSKFNAYTPEFIECTGIRAIIGKGGMDEATLDAMKKFGCVYLAVVGGCSAIYTERVECIQKEYNTEPNWADNMLLLKLNNFGPLYVAMDAHGNSVYEQIKDNTKDNLQQIYESIGIN